MVGIFQLATLASLAFGAVASCKRYAVDVQPFKTADCIDHDVRKAFTVKEGQCRSSHFRKYPAAGVRILSHGRNVDDEKRACRLFWYENKHCHGAQAKSEDLHIDSSFKCYNTTLKGTGLHPVGIRSVRLHCDEVGQELYPPQSNSVFTTRCTSTTTYPPIKSAPTSSTSARVVVTTELVVIPSPVTKTKLVTTTRPVIPSSSSSSSATATIKSTTTIVAPPTATIEGTTTVWVASASTKSSTTSSTKSSTTSSIKSSTTSSSKTASVSTSTIVTSAARTVTSTVTPTSSSTHHSTRTSTWVAVITDAAKMKLDRRSDVQRQTERAPDGSIECYISLDGHWLISTCIETTKAAKTASA